MARNLQKIGVMLVDDSAVVRTLLKRIITDQPDMEVIHTSPDGEQAVKDYEQIQPDVVIMDIEMPKMDGIQAVKKIIAMDADARIVMCSSHTQTGSKKTFESLDAGALDFMSKPSPQSIDLGESFKVELANKVRTAHYANPANAQAQQMAVKKEHNETAKATTKTNGDTEEADLAKPARIAPALTPVVTQKLPALSDAFPSVIMIGSSTGGPNALVEVLKELDDKNLKVPVFITQHMPEGFTKGLVDTLTQKTKLKIFEAIDGMAVHGGCIYIAPGGKHLSLKKEGSIAIKLLDGESVNFCKPSIDVMIREVKKIYPTNMLVVLLTGMGADGKDACHELSEANIPHVIIAQDEATSVVWGIPGGVAKARLCHAVLPLSEIAKNINELVSKRRLL